MPNALRSQPSVTRAAALAAAALFMLYAATGGQSEARAANDPYARVPAVGDHVRFDASVGGERMAWAYPSLNYLEAFLRSTIDAALSSTSYEDYQKKMGLVLGHSLTIANGAQGTVQHVQRFYYRDHQDVEVQVRVDSGQLSHGVVWTTPAELVDSSGHKYLR